MNDWDKWFRHCLKKSIFDGHKLKEGDFVKVYIDPANKAEIITE